MNINGVSLQFPDLLCKGIKLQCDSLQLLKSRLLPVTASCLLASCLLNSVPEDHRA